MTYIHDVPNHLEVEDTFVLGLTVRQCVIVGCGAAMAYGLFNDLFSSIPNPAIGLVVGLVAAFLLFGVLLAVALVRVGGRGLDEWDWSCWFIPCAPRCTSGALMPLMLVSC